MLVVFNYIVKNRLEAFEIWIWCRWLKISWKDKVTMFLNKSKEEIS